MKKKIIIAVLLVLLFAVALLIVIKENRPEKTAEEPVAAETVAETAAVEATEQAAEPEAEPVRVETIDYDALYKAYAPDTVIGTIEGREVTWEEYYGWLSFDISQMQSTMDQYRMYYGVVYNWSDDIGLGDGRTYADAMTESAEINLKDEYALSMLLEETGRELSEENLASIAEQKESDIESCGCATEEEFRDYLQSIHITDGVYEYFIVSPEYADIIKEEKYGSDGEKIDQADIDNYIEENGYMNVNHILRLTMDMNTGEELGEEEKAKKLSEAEDLLAELKKIKDPEKLVARFRELKEEYCEDSGKVTNPDGYVFTKGTMVEEFETAAEQLDVYGLSEIVETTYGYHILLRLPLDGDTVIEENDYVEPVTIKQNVADELFDQMHTEKSDALELMVEEGFKLNMTDYILVTEQ